MDTPIHYLDLLIILASIFPSGFSFSMSTVFGKYELRRMGVGWLLALLAPFLTILMVVLYLRPELLSFNTPEKGFYVAAILCAPICILVEYYLSALSAHLAERRWRRGVTLHPVWRSRLSVSFVTTLTAVAAAEELVYRQVWFRVLSDTFDAPTTFTLVLSSLFYGVNHLFYGLRTVSIKVVMGLVYGGLYLASNNSVSDDTPYGRRDNGSIVKAEL